MSGMPQPAEARVTTLELFFDLVFVFAITQLTSVLAHDMSLRGLARVVLMFVVLWWMYGGYAWLANTIAPTTPVRRLTMLVGMAGFFMVALATPTAFSGGGIVWGLGYLILVSAHAVLYAQDNPHILRVLPANLLAALFIVAAGIFDHGAPAHILWTFAVVVPIVQPYVAPAGGRFRIRAGHIVERHGLLVMITIGESIVAIGVGAGRQELTAGLIVTVLVSLALAAAVWWSYFDRDGARAERALRAADDVSRTDRTMFGYFYAHIPIVIGIVVMAAGVQQAVARSWNPLGAGPACALACGTATYLLGDAAYRHIVGIGPSKIRIATAVLCLLTIPLGRHSAATEALALTALLGLALVAESRARKPRLPLS
ncbi:MAG: low temperature requirement protein A [Mycobacteriaceae bacterium]|nr:low temperature requirement protein A [Mycobacteriaceae bacterium]